MKRTFLTAAVALGAFAAWAFPEVPRESSKALGVTRGRLFSSGLVFVNGKFIAPPYRVERWGTGLRINKVPVTGQVVAWSEFLKTQPGFEPPPAPAALPPPTPPARAPAPEEDELSLDDLFDDAPPPPKKQKKSPKPVAAASSSVPASEPEPPSLTAPFVKNAAAKALVKRVNVARAEIDRTLRAGGFICFGDGYSRIVGDARAATRLLDALPEIQMKSETSASFCAAVRAAKLDYLHELVSEDLFRNRIDYRKLQEHREKLRKEREWQKMTESQGTQF